MTDVQKVAMKVFHSKTLEGVRCRNRYLPKICFKCGKVLRNFAVQTNGFHHCLTCEKPITLSLLEIMKKIFKDLVKNLEADGENTIRQILLDDEV
ncbi:hypothetical protein KKG41_01555 [Patescibacteria group bacterium]|nr:hypothetical protein [Patescibacteria group bacterium]